MTDPFDGIDPAAVPPALRVRCPECGGAGECATSHKYTCYDCRGRGWVPAPGVRELVDALTGKKS